MVPTKNSMISNNSKSMRVRKLQYLGEEGVWCLHSGIGMTKFPWI